jgi:hypothetical protein
VTLYAQLQRALSAEGIGGSIQRVLLALRTDNDTAHLSFRQMPSEADAQRWLATEGRRFRPPVGVLRKEPDDAPVQLPPSKVIQSTESIAPRGSASAGSVGASERRRSSCVPVTCS